MRSLTNGQRVDRLMARVLRLEQVWGDRITGDRWIVHQIHSDDLRVTIRRADRARRRTISYRDMLAGYSLIIDAGKRGPR